MAARHAICRSGEHADQHSAISLQNLPQKPKTSNSASFSFQHQSLPEAFHQHDHEEPSSSASLQNAVRPAINMHSSNERLNRPHPINIDYQNAYRPQPPPQSFPLRQPLIHVLPSASANSPLQSNLLGGLVAMSTIIASIVSIASLGITIWQALLQQSQNQSHGRPSDVGGTEERRSGLIPPEAGQETEQTPNSHLPYLVTHRYISTVQFTVLICLALASPMYLAIAVLRRRPLNPVPGGPTAPTITRFDHAALQSFSNSNGHLREEIVGFSTDAPHPQSSNCQQAMRPFLNDSHETHFGVWQPEPVVAHERSDYDLPSYRGTATSLPQSSSSKSYRDCSFMYRRVGPTPDYLSAHKTQGYQPVVYDCPFDRLGCYLTFSSFETWYAHSLKHFGDAGPPVAARCPFCSQRFQARDASEESWRARMEYVRHHHEQTGERLGETSRLDEDLYRYLWRERLIDDITYKELSVWVGGKKIADVTHFPHTGLTKAGEKAVYNSSVDNVGSRRNMKRREKTQEEFRVPRHLVTV